jgi:hypothetical protein
MVLAETTDVSIAALVSANGGTDETSIGACAQQLWQW